MRTSLSILLGSIFLLLCIGLIIVTSSSYVKAEEVYKDGLYFTKKQFIWILLGLIACYFCARIDYHLWLKLFVMIYLVSIVALILVLIPGIGVSIRGSKRWINILNFQFQPSEFVKAGMIIAMAGYCTRYRPKMGEFIIGSLIPVICLGICCVLLLLEPDFGTAILVGLTGMILLFIAGARPAYLIMFGFMGIIFIAVLLCYHPERLERVIAFLWPEKYPEISYQLEQSKLAFILGGIFGRGLGNSIQKFYYLPEAHTDFILAIIAEELGIVAVCIIILLYFLITWTGLMTGRNAPDFFGRIVASGIAIQIGLQFIINAGVVTGFLPTKGLPLPFISYGGSSMIAIMCAAGILVNIIQHCSGIPDGHVKLIKDALHRI